MTLCARPVLGEEIGAVGWISALLGFAGILLIVRPGSGLDPLGVLLALCNVAVGVVYYLLSRVLARTEQTVALLFYVALVGAISFGLALPYYWFGTAPGGFDIALFLLLGLSGGLAHFLITAAYRYAEASLLGPISYTHLLWSGLFGWLIFHHMPDALTILGMAVIAASGVLVALRARFSKGARRT
ncbi:MAG: DMT family transporter [Sphingobium sp.]